MKESKEHIKGIILSAGESSRMGRPKALLRLPSGDTLLTDQVLRLKEAGVSRIYVVVGCEAKRIKSIHRTAEVLWVMNDHWHLGGFSSLIAGLRAISSHPTRRLQGVVLLPIDVAGVEPEIIKQIIDEGLRTNKNIIPRYNGRGGHPVYICRKTMEKILQDFTEKDGRLDYILTHDAETFQIPVASASILNNINTMNDWNNYLKTFLG